MASTTTLPAAAEPISSATSAAALKGTAMIVASAAATASLAGVIVYIYPVFVALLSLRFATRLPGRRPWFALALAVVGIVLALGGVDVSADLPIQGILLILASAAIYSVWIVLSARLSGERRDRLGSEVPADATAARDAAGTTAVMMTATALVFAASRAASVTWWPARVSDVASARPTFPVPMMAMSISGFPRGAADLLNTNCYC